MRRRELLALGGATAASSVFWPLTARAQPRGQMRRVAILMLYAESDPEGQIRATAFRRGLERAGWVPGRNIVVDYLWGVLDPDLIRTVTAELRRLAPDVIVVNSSTGLREIESTTRTVPIVFVGVSEPVAQGFAASLAHPGGNMTGFSNLEPTLGAKWLDLLKAVAPQARRVAFIYNPGNPGAKVHLQSAQSAAERFSVEVIEAPIHDLAEIEAAITTLGREPGGALVVPPDPFLSTHRKRIVELTLRDRLPTISGLRSIADAGGLLAYGVYIPELFRQAGGYVDRILRGEKPANLPIVQPTRFDLVVNLKTAKVLGLTVPDNLLALADEVIE
jgi:putative tryptophan/tyrosine transport system substrate-binding protein